MKVKSYFVRVFIKAFLLLSISLLTSCGGGSVGTGGQSVVALNRVEGIVVDRNSVPISGLNVSIDGVEAVTITDVEGSFAIDIVNNEVLDFSQDSNQVVLNFKVSIDGIIQAFEFDLRIDVDAANELAQVDIVLDVPDELLALLR